MIQAILSFLLVYKYPAIFVITFFASFILPLPATATLLASGAFASQGYLSMREVLAVGFIGSILGDNLAYYISFRWGESVLARIGFKRVLQSEKFKKLGKYFLDSASSTIFFSRFLVTALGIPANILSGLYKISYKKYAFFELTGELVYVLMYAGIGYLVGSEWQDISGVLENIGILLLLVIVILLVKKLYFGRNHD